MKFDLLSVPPTGNMRLNLVLWNDRGHPLYTQLLFEIEQGASLTGARRELQVQTQEPRSFEISRAD
jgi:hypothetical protein